MNLNMSEEFIRPLYIATKPYLTIASRRHRGRRHEKLGRSGVPNPKVGCGATTDINGLLLTYAAKQLTSGLEERTVKGRISVLKLLAKRGANLLDPYSAFKAIDHAKRYDNKTKTLKDEE